MLRGIRRLFATLAVLWLIVAGLVWASGPSPDPSGELKTILIEAGILYGIGWLITFVAQGFRFRKPPTIIDVTPGSPRRR